ncbi:Sterol 3-beta-glucosyltransferase UGT80B1 [Penicillium maclennaniae]|uniref:Sterol 3-beta-glucosyltransferase UGT80B1 n=1 Tax=Penicillium maclennaniae TaxID=1343394 RepID=UPI0025414E77|nr:Sterol 3-beta-glucosyltransferase UGT80B1 [Penicillium maclennaniae]KAJ5675180.1 Sterol 3-beta-glucosyltransferase UGT80B1 [Penicillium maclennaniae]
MAPADSEAVEPPAIPHGGIQTEDWSEALSLPYSHDSDRLEFSGDGLNTGVRVLSDGRLDIRINERKPSLAGILHHLGATPMPSELSRVNSRASRASRTSSRKGERKAHVKHFPLQLNIVIQVIGSRGDIQPFVALGKELKKHGHRVRLATHLAFREFVNEGGLEFFNIGGDPAELMAFMVKNPGLLPSLATLRSGAIQKRRREMKEIIEGCWKSCYETGDGTHMHQIKDDPFSEEVDYRRRPFVADVIIANPPSLAHIHCAQRLGIPLHIMFTMPWSPTQSFPHPLAILHPKDCQPTVANFVSYAIVDMMVWEGLGDLVNKFRKNVLALDPLDSITAPSLIHRLQIPCSYLWSPAVLPKPVDWGDNIDICGFSFLPANPDYTPPNEIKEFLEAGPTPIYVGFGSIVVDDQVKLTKIVFEAVKKSGQRAIVSKGWGNLGVDEVDVPENILLIGSCPHDWLFQHVSCVVHHGGAGTTAAGLALGCPTIIIPFFGDQEFWGHIVATAGAGPVPIPHKRLTVENLSNAIEMALKDSTKEKAQAIAKKMKDESGVKEGVCSFHRQLNLRPLRCAVCPSRPAVWHLKHTEVGLSAFAASTLVEMGKLDPESLVLNRPMEYDTYRDPAGPISASAQVLFGAIANFVIGIADVPAEMVNDLVSAGKHLSHNHQTHHEDAHRKWHMHKTHNEDELASENDSQEQADQQKGRKSDESPNHSHSDSSHDSFAQPANAGTRSSEPMGDEETGSDDSVSNSSDIPPDAGIDRVRSLQLEKTQTMSSEMAPSKHHGFLNEVRLHGAKMGKRFVNFVIWIPTDLSLSMSKGFHNAPKLYHDYTVKPTPKVHGIRSGFRAAGQELRDGFYYGVTGLVTQPRHGYQEKGAKGMMKGLGKGLGGVFLKPPAGLWGLAGYPLTGVRRNLLDSLGRTQEGQIVASRIAQGHEEMRKSSTEDRMEVARKWALVEEKLHDTNRRCRRSQSHSSAHPHALTYTASCGMAA